MIREPGPVSPRLLGKKERRYARPQDRSGHPEVNILDFETEIFNGQTFQANSDGKSVKEDSIFSDKASQDV